MEREGETNPSEYNSNWLPLAVAGPKRSIFHLEERNDILNYYQSIFQPTVPFPFIIEYPCEQYFIQIVL